MTVRIVSSVLAREVPTIDNTHVAVLIEKIYVIPEHSRVKNGDADAGTVEAASSRYASSTQHVSSTQYARIPNRVRSHRERDVAHRLGRSVQRNVRDLVESRDRFDQARG